MNATANSPCTLEAFAQHKRLNPAVLRDLRIRDGAGGLLLPCLDENGEATRTMRVRRCVENAHPTTWSGKPMLYGLQTLRRGRERCELVFVEGESDQITLHEHGIPALGVPGWSMTHLIEHEHVDRIERVYVTREPDEAGSKFVVAIVNRLRDIGWGGGVVNVVDLHALYGAKDPSDLHIADPDSFKERWAAAIATATPYADPARTTVLQTANAAEVEWDEQRPWPMLDPAAYYGLAGEIVRALEPETEADPAALLFTVLALAGNMAGKNTCARVHDDDHPPRLFVVIVGGSMTGAKGTGYAALRPFLRAADAQYLETRVQGGFGSGEAIVSELQPKDGLPFDPRLLILETEYARLLAINGRDASTTSMMIRQAWDGNKLEARRSKDKAIASNHHISCLAHITPDELRARLTENDTTNGFGNRFLYCASRRSKQLPFGGHVAPSLVGHFGRRLRAATDRAFGRSTISFASSACDVWSQFYRAEPERAGLVGSLVARAHPQKLRLAVTYAILDEEADSIEPAHVLAAEACWRYSVATVEYIFGNLRGDVVQDRLLSALRDAYPAGFTGAEQAALFGRNLKAGQLLAARNVLEHDGFIRREVSPSGEKGGRPEIVYRAVPSLERTKNDDSNLSAGFIRVDSSPSASPRSGVKIPDDPGEEVLD